MNYTRIYVSPRVVTVAEQRWATNSARMSEMLWRLSQSYTYRANALEHYKYGNEKQMWYELLMSEMLAGQAAEVLVA